MHFYQFNIGDYRRDASHLTLLEHGVYRQLLDTYYLDEKPLTKDLTSLMRTHCIRTAEEEQALKNVLKDFFDDTPEGFIHSGCDRVIEAYRKKSRMASESAKARWSQSHANALPTESESNADGMLTNNHKPITNNQEPNKTSLSGSIPTCPHQQVVDLFHKTLPELPEVRIWNTTREGLLKARWRETAKRLEWANTQDGIEYFEKLFNWIRQSKFLMGQVNPKPGQRPFECELEWILRPQNWAKLIEGKYHAV